MSALAFVEWGSCRQPACSCGEGRFAVGHTSESICVRCPHPRYNHNAATQPQAATRAASVITSVALLQRLPIDMPLLQSTLTCDDITRAAAAGSDSAVGSGSDIADAADLIDGGSASERTSNAPSTVSVRRPARRSLGRHSAALPLRSIAVDEFGSFIKFVNREEQCAALVSHLQTSYLLFRQRAVMKPEERIGASDYLKNMQVVYSAGAPGIGKTTWARMALDHVPPSCKIEVHFQHVLHRCIENGWRYRICFGEDVVARDEFAMPKESLAARLLWQHLKYEIPRLSCVNSYAAFWSYLCDHRLQLNAADVVGYICGTTIPRAERMLLVNFDEVNVLFPHTPGLRSTSTQHSEYLQAFLRALLQLQIDGVAFVMPVLTATTALRVREVISLSGCAFREIPLPLLTPLYVHDMVTDLLKRSSDAVRGTAKRGEHATDSTEGDSQLDLSATGVQQSSLSKFVSNNNSHERATEKKTTTKSTVADGRSSTTGRTLPIEVAAATASVPPSPSPLTSTRRKRKATMTSTSFASSTEVDSTPRKRQRVSRRLEVDIAIVPSSASGAPPPHASSDADKAADVGAISSDAPVADSFAPVHVGSADQRQRPQRKRPAVNTIIASSKGTTVDRRTPTAYLVAQLPLTDSSVQRQGVLPPLLCDLLELMAGHPRFLEKLLFRLGRTDGAAEVWSATTFLHSIAELGGVGTALPATDRMETWLSAVATEVLTRYSAFNRYLLRDEFVAIAPQLLGYTLFEWSIHREQQVSEGSFRCTVQQLEEDGVVFLTPKPLSPAASGTVVSSSSHAVNSHVPDVEMRLVIPFLWLHVLYDRHAAAYSSSVVHLSLVKTLTCRLSPAQNEELTLSLLALKCFHFAKQGVTFVSGQQLFGISTAGADIQFRLPSLETTQWAPVKLRQQVKAENWHEWYQFHVVPRCRSESTASNTVGASVLSSAPRPHFFLNAEKAPFWDSCILTDPPIFVQDKQSLHSRERTAHGKESSTISWRVVEKERTKCGLNGSNTDPVFLFCTDEVVIDRPHELPPRVIIIDRNVHESFFGPIIARRKAMCLSELAVASHVESVR